MEKDYITIKEYAGYLGRTVQSVYAILKKDDNYLKDYLYTINGKRDLKASVLELNNIRSGANEATDTIQNDYEQEQEKSINLLEEYKEQIKFLKEQIAKKDETISVLENTITEQIRVINNSQKLLLVEKTTNGKVILNNTEEAEENSTITSTSVVEPVVKKKHFWFFGRR